MSVDATKRKLKMPPWHVPYLQKHRIYELFNAIGRQLLIQQPMDHVLFVKRTLQLAVCNRDKSRVILICSAKVNASLLATRMAEHSGALVIDNDFISKIAKKERKKLSPLTLARVLYNITSSHSTQKRGWILADVFKNDQDAKAALSHGLYPTHVFHLICPTTPPIDTPIYCNVPESWPAQRRALAGLRKVYHHLLQEVHLLNRDVKNLVAHCLELSKSKPHVGPRSIRLCILGPRGSGRKTIANMLAAKLDLVHVDFEHILCEAWTASSTELGKALHSVKEHVCFDVGLMATVVNERLLQTDCLQRGYVLTGYPNTVDDFKCLDIMDTPPNRVVFLQCDTETCQQRLINRKVNVYTGSLYNLIEQPERVLGKHLMSHPKDQIEIINAELNYYWDRVDSLLEYCGESAEVVVSSGALHCTFDNICKIVMEAAQPVKLRDPYTNPKEQKNIPTVTEILPETISSKSLIGESEYIEEKCCVVDYYFK